MGNSDPRLLRLLGVLALQIAACSSSVSDPANPNSGSTGGTIPNTMGGAEAGTAGAAQGGGPVTLSGVVNARQPGGLTSVDGRHVRANMLIRSGDLHDLDATGCTELEVFGVRTIVDLRDATDRSARPDATCATTGRSYQPIELPKLLPPSNDNYLATLIATEPKLPSIFGTLGTANALSAVIHCVIGRDRASLVTALVLLAVGVPESAVLDDMVRNQDANVQIDPTWMDGSIARIHGAGGIEAYLAAQAVPESALSTLRASVLE